MCRAYLIRVVESLLEGKDLAEADAAVLIPSVVLVIAKQPLSQVFGLLGVRGRRIRVDRAHRTPIHGQSAAQNVTRPAGSRRRGQWWSVHS